MKLFKLITKLHSALLFPCHGGKGLVWNQSMECTPFPPAWPSRWLEQCPRVLLQKRSGFPRCLLGVSLLRKGYPQSDSRSPGSCGHLDSLFDMAGDGSEASPNSLCDHILYLLVLMVLAFVGVDFFCLSTSKWGFSLLKNCSKSSTKKGRKLNL